jgi:hypothetical protein
MLSKPDIFREAASMAVADGSERSGHNVSPKWLAMPVGHSSNAVTQSHASKLARNPIGDQR